MSLSRLLKKATTFVEFSVFVLKGKVLELIRVYLAF